MMYGLSGLYGRPYGDAPPADRPASTGAIAAAESEMKWQELQLSDRDERDILEAWDKIKAYLNDRTVSMAMLYANMTDVDRRKWNDLATAAPVRIGLLWSAAKRLKPALDWRRKNEEIARAARASEGEDESPEEETSALPVLIGAVAVAAVIGGAVLLLRRRKE